MKDHFDTRKLTNLKMNVWPEVILLAALSLKTIPSYGQNGFKLPNQHGFESSLSSQIKKNPKIPLKAAVATALKASPANSLSFTQIYQTLLNVSQQCNGQTNKPECPLFSGMSEGAIYDTLKALETDLKNAKDDGSVPLREEILKQLDQASTLKGLNFQETVELLPSIKDLGEKDVQQSGNITPQNLFTDEEKEAIVELTTQVPYIRFYENLYHTCPERRDSYNKEKILKALADLKTLNNAIKRLPKFVGTVYRGVDGVTKEQINSLFEKYMSKGDLNLRSRDYYSIVSTSRNIRVAQQFAGTVLNDDPNSFKVLYRIHQRNGVSVENASNIPQEKEVLIGEFARFRISGIAKFKAGKGKVFIVDAVEVTPDHALKIDR